MDISNLQPYQGEAIKKALDCISNGTNRINIAMPPGSGKSAVVINIVREYIALNIKKGPKVLVITRTVAEQQHLTEQFKKDDHYITITRDIKGELARPSVRVLTFSTPEANIPLDDGNKRFDMILFLGGNLTNPALEDVFGDYPNAIQMVITDFPETNPRFGEPVFSYTLKDAIKDAVLFKPYEVKQISVLPQELRREFNEVTTNNMRTFLRASKGHLKDAASRLLQEIQDDKTVVYCPNLAFAKEFADIINEEIGNRAHAISISNSMALEERILRINLYKENVGEPFILCVANPNLFGTDLAMTKSVAILTKINSLSALQNMLIPGLRPYKEKKVLQVLDFVGLEDLFAKLENPSDLEEHIIIEEITEEQKEEVQEYFKKSNISFRDKKEIEGVLGVDDLSAELAEIISVMPPEQGSMIGIFGQWGRGKTFLMDQTWAKLEKKKTFIKVDFHAWKYQDTPATWAYLYECLADVYVKPGFDWDVETWGTRVSKLVRLNFKRKGVLPILKVAAILSGGVFVFLLGTQLFHSFDEALKPAFTYFGIALTSIGTIYALLKTVSKEYGSKARDLFLKYSTRHSYKAHLGLQAEIQKETLTLLKVWIPEKDLKKQKVLLFVEDIDRCSEGKIIQIIDALRVLLEDTEIAKRVIVVTAVDERMLKLAIKMKYHSLIALDKKDEVLHSRALGKITDEYIDKLFIAGLKLGDLSRIDADDFLVALTKPDREHNSVSALQTLLDEETRQIRARYARHILEAEDEYDMEQHQNQHDMMDYGEPDFAIEYLESSAALPESPEAPLKELAAENISKTLSNEEIDILRVSITKLHGATPRQIRIFYYRYLIAKNLLIRRYKTLKKSNVWQTRQNCRILATLIVLYTLHEEEGILNKHLEEALKNSEDRQHIQLMTETVVSGFDYRELLKVLSVVIAY